MSRVITGYEGRKPIWSEHTPSEPLHFGGIRGGELVTGESERDRDRRVARSCHARMRERQQVLRKVLDNGGVTQTQYRGPR